MLSPYPSFLPVHRMAMIDRVLTPRERGHGFQAGSARVLVSLVAAKDSVHCCRFDGRRDRRTGVVALRMSASRVAVRGSERCSMHASRGGAGFQREASPSLRVYCRQGAISQHGINCSIVQDTMTCDSCVLLSRRKAWSDIEAA